MQAHSFNNMYRMNWFLLLILFLTGALSEEKKEGYERVVYEFNSETWIDNPSTELTGRELAATKTHVRFGFMFVFRFRQFLFQNGKITLE